MALDYAGGFFFDPLAFPGGVLWGPTLSSGSFFVVPLGSSGSVPLNPACSTSKDLHESSSVYWSIEEEGHCHDSQEDSGAHRQETLENSGGQR